MDAIVNWISYQFHITFIEDSRYLLFLEGFKNTLIIAIGALVLGFVLGTLIAIIKVSYAQMKGMNGVKKILLRILNGVASTYLAVFRGTPIVVQLMIMYFIVLAKLNNGVLVATIAFGINSGAYVAEIVRAGILAVDIGQTEAGRSLGLPPIKTMRLIILPQAIKNILPALGNECITLIKETSVAGYITVMDLARAGAYVRSRTLEPYFSLLFIALVYFVWVYGLTVLLKHFERRLRKGDRS